ncbi:MAG: hypothetical protein Kilf2KO_07900 [Rhodospirillales bacterium]
MKSRPRLLWILLVLSLALNVSLIIGALYNADQPGRAPRGEEMVSNLGERLGLSEAQRRDLLAIRGSVVDRYAARDRMGKDWGSVLAGVLRQPTFDGGAMKLDLIARDAGRVDFFVATLSRLYDFTNSLEPDARQIFLTEMEADQSFLPRLFGPDPREEQQVTQNG